MTCCNPVNKHFYKVPFSLAPEPHIGLIKRTIHNRQRDFQNINFMICVQIKWPERVAHSIPESGTIRIPKSCIVLESCFTQIFPRIRHFKAEIMIPVTEYWLVSNFFQSLLLYFHLLCIEIGSMPPMKPHFPPAIDDLPNLRLKVFDCISIILLATDSPP